MLSPVSVTRAHISIPLALTVVLATMLAGCGGSGDDLASKSASEILAASRTAAQSASSAHVLSTTTDGKRTPFTLDLELASDGAHMHTAIFGHTREVIRIGDTVYIKGGPLLYARLAKRTGNHVPVGTWLKETPTTSMSEETELRTELRFLIRTATSLTKGDTDTTIDGQKAIELKTKGRLSTGSIYIAATGKPYPIQIVSHGREAGLTTFSAWNQRVAFTAPPNAVELSGLEHTGH